jgi:hypothetical protein
MSPDFHELFLNVLKGYSKSGVFKGVKYSVNFEDYFQYKVKLAYFAKMLKLLKS